MSGGVRIVNALAPIIDCTDRAKEHLSSLHRRRHNRVSSSSLEDLIADFESLEQDLKSFQSFVLKNVSAEPFNLPAKSSVLEGLSDVNRNIQRLALKLKRMSRSDRAGAPFNNIEMKESFAEKS